jgi:cell division protein FtsN
MKNKNKFNLIAAIIFTILGLTLKAYTVNSQKPESDIQKQPEINLVIQVGAFIKETNATVFKEKLSAIIDKRVIMVVEEGYYKVQLTGFNNIEEIEKIIPALGLIGIRDFWIPPARKDASVTDIAELQADTTQKILEEKIVNPVIPMGSDSLIIEEPPAESPDIYSLEIGAFRKKNQALNAQEKVITKLKLPVEIVEQWNDYHVIITGFNNKTEINKYIPELARMGYSEIYVLKNYKKIQ